MEILISYSPTILKHAMVQRLETTFLKVQGSWTLPCIVSGLFFLQYGVFFLKMTTMRKKTGLFLINTCVTL